MLMTTRVWHRLKEVIAPSRYVKALRQVTKGRWGEMTFISMPLSDVSIREMDNTVKIWDLIGRNQEEKRKHGTQPSVNNVERTSSKSNPHSQYQKQQEIQQKIQAGL